MKKLFFLLILSLAFSSKAQTCTALYSYGANFETVHFFNQSVVANAHYYWNFGDGTGSNFKEPIHEFPENGNYLVVLYVNDTISNCSNFYEQWLNITKYSTEQCSPIISDSIYFYNYFGSGAYYLKILDFSVNCNSYTPIYKVGYASGPFVNVFGIGLYPANFISSAYYFDSNNALKRMALKTSPNLFNRNKNFQSCSANFEFSVVSENSTGQTILFKAMNKSAVKYDWLITDFGNPITSIYDTISIHYSDDPYSQFPNIPHIAVLTVQGQNGCRDSLLQHVLIKTKSSTYVGLREFNAQDINLKIYPNPVFDKLRLEFDQAKVKPDQLSICNTLGQTLLILKNPQPQQEIDLSNFTPGVYFFKVQNSSCQKMFKVLKE